jgi:hypothetical protein
MEQTHRQSASSGIRTNDPSVRAGEDGSCLRPRGPRDRQDNSCKDKKLKFTRQIKNKFRERGFESHPKTLPQHSHIALTAVATVHIGNSTECPLLGPG